MLVKVRKLAFKARLAQAVDDVADCRPRSTANRDEAAAREIISQEVDRIAKQHARTVRQNIDHRDLMTLARSDALKSS